jgi:hypothetical protein
MAKPAASFDDALSAASGLSPLDKVRLMERLASMLENDLARESTEKRMTFKELATWLDAHPPEEPWGDLKDNEDAGEYIHRMRRQSTI